MISSALLMAAATMTSSCSNDDDSGKIKEEAEELIAQILSITDADFKSGNLPSSTTENPGITINTNSSALAGGGNILRITSPVPLKKIQVGVEGIGGYLECVPQLVTPAAARNAESSTADIYEYVVEVMYALSLETDIELNVNAVTENGDVVSLLRQEAIDYVESQKGDLAINLVFDQLKDVDLHLFTPDSIHIFYGNRQISYAYSDEIWEQYYADYNKKQQELAEKYGLNYSDGEVWYENESDYDNYIAYWEEIEAWSIENDPERNVSEGGGLDHDSNPGCLIDSLNNENIVIKADFLTPGTYKVLINMYSNCSPLENETNWTVIARLADKLITPVTGANPCSGKFEADAPSNSGDNVEHMTLAMTFTLTQAQIDALKPAAHIGKKPAYIFRHALDDKAVMKLMDANHLAPKYVMQPIQRVK